MQKPAGFPEIGIPSLPGTGRLRKDLRLYLVFLDFHIENPRRSPPYFDKRLSTYARHAFEQMGTPIFTYLRIRQSLFYGGYTLLLVIMGCSISPVISKVIVEQPNRLVRLDVTYRSGLEEHSHPTSISPSHLTTLLTSVKVLPHVGVKAVFADSQERSGAFSPDQI